MKDIAPETCVFENFSEESMYDRVPGSFTRTLVSDLQNEMFWSLGIWTDNRLQKGFQELSSLVSNFSRNRSRSGMCERFFDDILLKVPLEVL